MAAATFDFITSAMDDATKADYWDLFTVAALEIQVAFITSSMGVSTHALFWVLSFHLSSQSSFLFFPYFHVYYFCACRNLVMGYFPLTYGILVNSLIHASGSCPAFLFIYLSSFFGLMFGTSIASWFYISAMFSYLVYMYTWSLLIFQFTCSLLIFGSISYLVIYFCL